MATNMNMLHPLTALDQQINLTALENPTYGLTRGLRVSDYGEE